VGDTDVVAEYLGSYSVTHDFVDHYRASGKEFDYMWEERWVRDLPILDTETWLLVHRVRVDCPDTSAQMFER